MATPETRGAERDLFDDVVRIQATQPYPDRLPAIPSPLKRLAAAVEEARAATSSAFDALRHVVQDPEDAAAAMCGAMMSKDYGAHERPHTEHHIYRGSPHPAPRASSGPAGAWALGAGTRLSAGTVAERGEGGGEQERGHGGGRE